MGHTQWSAWPTPSSWWPSRDSQSRERGYGWRQQRSTSPKKRRTRTWRACQCGQWTFEDRLGQKPSSPCGREWPQGGQAAGEGTQDQLAAAEADPVVVVSRFLLPLVRVLGGDPSTAHLATALILPEQRKASDESAKAVWV